MLVQLAWVMDEDGWQLCFILTSAGPQQTAYKTLKVCIVSIDLSDLGGRWMQSS